MSYKVFSLLFMCLLGLQLNCRTGQALENNLGNTTRETTETAASEEKIKQLFVNSGLGEDDGFYTELMVFPREKIIGVVQKIKENGLSKDDEQYFNESSNEILKMKAASFLWTLGVEREANEQYIVDIERKKDSRHFYAFEHLLGFVMEGKKEYLPIIFEDSPRWDGAYLYVQWNFYNELEAAPRTFLLYLSKQPFKIRKVIYEVITLKGETYDERRFEKIKANIAALKNDREMKAITGEFLREVNKKR